MDKTENEYDTVIVGAGIGGLTCGAFLAKAGKRVLLCEQHSKPGGYVTSFERKGFIFDGGSQSFASNGIVFPILHELGLWDKVKFVKVDYQLITPDLNVKLNSIEEVKDALRKAFPSEKEIDGYFNELEGMIKPLRRMYKSTVPLILNGWKKFVGMFLMPFINPWFFINNLRYRGITSVDLLDKYITDENVRLILSSLGAQPVMGAMSMANMCYSWIDDYWYPIGGMQKFADIFKESIEKNGSTINLKKKVDKIIIKNGKAVGIRFEDGREVRSKFIVSNADYKQTFMKLVSGEIEEEFLNRVMEAKVSEPYFCVYLGTDLSKEMLKKINAHHVFYYPNYNKKDINDPNFFEEKGMEFSFPSLTDDSLAPEGKFIITLTTPASYDWMNKWQTEDGKRTKKYRILKEKITGQLIETAEEIIPSLSEHVVLKDVATPLTYERYTLNTKGAPVGWSWDPKHAFFKEMQWSSAKLPIKNLFTVGHWSYMPGGVPSAMLTGKMVADNILKKLKSK